MKEKLKRLILEIEKTETKLSSYKKKVLELNSFIEDSEGVFDSNFDGGNLDEIQQRIDVKDKLIEETESFFKIGRWSFCYGVLEWSDETYRIFDYPEDYKGTLKEFYMSCVDYKTGDYLKLQHRLMRETSEGLLRNQIIITPSGNKKLLTFTSSPVLNDLGETIGIEGLVKDISSEIEGKKGLDNFFKLSQDLHCIVNFDRYFLKVSPSWINLLGYTEEELLSKSYMEFVHPDDVKATLNEIDDVDNNTSASQFENRYITKTGDVVYISWNSQLDPDTQLVYCTARDVTKSKLAQDELLSDLSSKDLLLREIHHRVKNNLQIISSLLSLQADANSEQKQLTKLYEDSRNRIQSMAAIHEMFYQSEQLDKIEFGKYMNKLIGDLSKSFSSISKTVQFKIDVDQIYVNLDTAIPLGLLINEIVTNSIKYGCDEKGNVDVFVNMEVLEGDKIRFIIGDRGVKSNPNILDYSGKSLGVLLINSLVEQIDGEIMQLNNSEGTIFKLTFKNKLI